jgi:CRISPR-associated exonuclease Cas4
MDIMLSALQHYAFCPRQCALIHLEQVWQENSHTALGRLMHETAHEGSRRMRDGVKVVTDLELRSSRLGLHGRADVVEFHRDGAGWKPYPVEYKKGRPHKGADADEVQLCAQALCLEEMLRVSIPEGALFYGEARRRRAVVFDEALRTRTEEVALAVRSLLESGVTPLPQELPWCDACSLNSWCIPELFDETASSYVRNLCEELQ